MKKGASKGQVLKWVIDAYGLGEDSEVNPEESQREFNELINKIKKLYKEKPKKVKKIKWLK